MRPDPYKRARSRLYKAKHGLLNPSKKQENRPDLPSNISEDYLRELNQSEDPDESNFQFDAFEDLSHPYSSKNASADLPYKYPRAFFDKIYQISRQNDFYIPNIKSNFDGYNFEHTVPEDYIIELISSTKDSTNIKSPLISQKLKLNEETVLEKSTATPKSDTRRQEKLELEDWLDEVL